MANSQTLANLTPDEAFVALMEIARNMTPEQARQFLRYTAALREEE